MRKRNRRPPCRKIVLKLPDLGHAQSAALNRLSSPHSRRTYKFAIEQLISWYCSEPGFALNRTVVLRFRPHLESLGSAAGTVNQRLAAVRRLAYEAADVGLLSPEPAAGIRRVKGAKQLGARMENWLIQDQAQLLLEKADGDDLRSARDLAMVSALVGCGLRRAQLSALTVEDLQIREGHWAIVDLVGEGGHLRTVPMPAWVKEAVDRWRDSAKVTACRIFRAVSRHGAPWGRGISENVIWYVVRSVAERMQQDNLAPHDLRRTCAGLCHVIGGELEQIQFLPGYVSALTTERYLCCKQNLEKPVNDRFDCPFSQTADLLEPLWREFPDHPGIPHYLIHAYDSQELAARGLAAARTYAKIAPSAPHALHMPSHIFTRLGMWDESIASNLAAAAVGSAVWAIDHGETLNGVAYRARGFLFDEKLD